MGPPPVKQQQQQQQPRIQPHFSPALAACACLLALGLAAVTPWMRWWFLYGAGIESLLVVCAPSRIFAHVPLWTLLATFNLVYAVSSTSWLLHALFAAACYPLILFTALFEYPVLSAQARKWLRKGLLGLHFTKDTIALFNLPALEIDTDVSGLFVVRGLSISFSSLRIVAHGVELGLLLTNDIELALYTDEVDIRLFRRIDIGEVFGSIKGGKDEMTFGDMDASKTDDNDSMFQADTAFLQAAGHRSRPNLSQMKSHMTGGSYMRDSSVKQTLNDVTTVNPADAKADEQYEDMLKQIRTGSAIYEARQHIQNTWTGSDNDERALVCAHLQKVPSVPHPASQSIRVTTLQQISPPWLRRFLHRLPFLLRLLLMPLSHLHPIRISSICIAGSGGWMTNVLQEHLFKHHGSEDSQIRKLQQKVSSYLASANLCLQLTEVDAIGQVPLSAAFDINNYLQFNDINAHRIEPDTDTVESIIRLGGADASVSVPSFLLPHHEHLLPARPDMRDLQDQQEEADLADGKPKTVQAEKELKKMKQDEVDIHISVHVRLPAWFDQSLLNFIAALVKASKVIDMETASKDEEAELEADSKSAATSSSNEDAAAPRTPTTFKSFASGLRQDMKDGRTGESLKDLARELRQTTKEGMKKAAVQGLVNDGWIAKMVGKIAAKLEQAQGDVGYSGPLSIPLEPYRLLAEPASKLLP